MKDEHIVSTCLSNLHHYFALSSDEGMKLTAGECREIARTIGDLHDAVLGMECKQAVRKAHTAEIIPLKPGNRPANGNKKS